MLISRSTLRRLATAPILRISLGLVLLTVCLLLITEVIGLVPDIDEAEMASRKVIAETAAVNISMQLAKQDFDAADEILRAVVVRNVNVLSAGLRTVQGGLLHSAGDHSIRWPLGPTDKSTSTHVQVPIFDAQKRWGSVELRFRPLSEGEGRLLSQDSFTMLVVFVALAGFVSYLLFLRKALRELNPASVIPERVRAALDMLAEGLLVIDADQRIVMANAGFARKLGHSPSSLIGKLPSELDWQEAVADDGEDRLPWAKTLQDGVGTTGAQIKVRSAFNEVLTFTVNTMPIAASEGRVRGAMVTFDDVTEVEKKNTELNRAFEQIQESQKEITRQNRELHILATRDPLTGCMNRRSLFEAFKTLFGEALGDGHSLSCIMADIDHFKAINDRYGHATGDKVIRRVSGVLMKLSRSNDVVGRYGGEEFCVLLPGMNIDEAVAMGETMRQAIQEGEGGRFTDATPVTASFGVSALGLGANDPAELVNQADKALYRAKETGRNRVVSWADAQAYVPDTATDKQAAQEPERAPNAGEAISADNDEGAAATETAVSEAGPTPGGDVGSAVFEGLQARIGALETALRRAERERDLAASSDPVTGLPNRTLFYDRIDGALERAGRAGEVVALLAVDIDALPRINSTLGHAAGERLIKEASARLRPLLRRSDTVAAVGEDSLACTVARVSTDEFAILLTDVKGVDSVTWVLKRVISALKDPITVDATEVYLNASIGVSVYPNDGEDADTLLGNASAAMREAKQDIGQERHRFYSEEINQRSKAHIRLEGDLTRAIDRDEFELYFQPKIDLRSGRIRGMEALIRWHHPRLGMVSPVEFIPVAEHTGLIDPIGHWVLRAACRQIKVWSESDHGEVPIAVNLSATQLRQPNLASSILAVLEETGLSAGLVELEITETGLMHRMDSAVKVIEDLSEAGFRIAIDDFGTGYSSLNYLKRFPLHTLKIDRSFLRDFTHNPRDAAIVSAIIAMAHNLGLVVVAEGVETEEQLHYLQDLRCDEIQGFLISRPLPRDKATRLLEDRNRIRRMIRPRAGADSSLVSAGKQFDPPEILGLLSDVPEMVGDANEMPR